EAGRLGFAVFQLEEMVEVEFESERIGCLLEEAPLPHLFDSAGQIAQKSQCLFHVRGRRIVLFLEGADLREQLLVDTVQRKVGELLAGPLMPASPSGERDLVEEILCLPFLEAIRLSVGFLFLRGVFLSASLMT